MNTLPVTVHAATDSGSGSGSGSRRNRSLSFLLPFPQKNTQWPLPSDTQPECPVVRDRRAELPDGLDTRFFHGGQYCIVERYTCRRDLMCSNWSLAGSILGVGNVSRVPYRMVVDVVGGARACTTNAAAAAAAGTTTSNSNTSIKFKMEHDNAIQNGTRPIRCSVCVPRCP